MNEVFEELVEEGRKEGGAKGIISMSLKFGKDKDFIISNLAAELSITTEKAEECYEVYSK